jgi:hypothetical protein
MELELEPKVDYRTGMRTKVAYVTGIRTKMDYVTGINRTKSGTSR